MLDISYKRKFSPLLLLISTAIWGSAVIITKGALDTIPFFWILTIRFAGAAFLLVLISFNRFHKFNLSYLFSGVIMGILLFLGYMFQTMSLQLTTPGKNGFLIAVYCILVPLLYWAIDKKRPDRYNVIAGFLCLAGVGFISLEGNDFSIRMGEILGLIAGLFFALNIIAAAKFVPNKDLFLLTTCQFVTFGFLSWICAMSISDPLPSISTIAIGQFIYLMVFASCGGFLLQYEGQKYTPPAAAAVILALEAPFTVVYSVIFGYEYLTPKIMTGFFLIFISIICSETKFSFLSKKTR